MMLPVLSHMNYGPMRMLLYRTAPTLTVMSDLLPDKLAGVYIRSSDTDHHRPTHVLHAQTLHPRPRTRPPVLRGRHQPRPMRSVCGTTMPARNRPTPHR